MIIDFRVRPPFKSLAALKHFTPDLILPKASPLLESPSSLCRHFIPSAHYKCIDRFLREMDEAGIGMAVVMGRVNDRLPTMTKSDNADILELCRLHPDRLIPFASFDPREEGALNAAKVCLAEGFKGLSFDIGYISMYPNDERMLPFYELANEYKAVVSLAMSSYIGPDLSYSDPTCVQPIAQAYPNVRFVLPHACWPHFDKAIGVATMCNNVFLCPDVFMCSQSMPFAADMMKAANSFLKGKIVFASSYPIRGLKESVDLWANLDLDRDALWHAYYYNAAKILNV